MVGHCDYRSWRPGALPETSQRFTTMICPTCSSSEFSAIRYGSVPGGRRLVGVASCLECRRIVRFSGRE